MRSLNKRGKLSCHSGEVIETRGKQRRFEQRLLLDHCNPVSQKRRISGLKFRSAEAGSPQVTPRIARRIWRMLFCIANADAL